MKYKNMTLGQIEAIINKLGGKEGVEKFLRGELVVSATKPVEFHICKIVKKVRLGIYKTPEAYRKALKKAGRGISDWSNNILDRITCSQEEVDLDFVVLSVGDLGFKDGARYADICAKAQELGLELCPAEVGPALRLQYGDQPSGEWLCIAMEAIDYGGDYLATFVVGNDNSDLLLGGDLCHLDYTRNASAHFVFGRRKK